MSREWSVALPAGAEPPYLVYVNGEERREGEHYEVDGRWLRFREPLRAPKKLGLGAKTLLAIGIGVYGRSGDSVDLRYHAGGQPQFATGLPVLPPTEI
jgi:hypothetical protein